MRNTIKIRRANVVLDIPPEEKDIYLAKGFDVVADDGDVLEKGEPVDAAELRRAYAHLKVEHEALLDDFKKLKSENAKLKKQLKDSKQPDKKSDKKSDK